MTTERNLILDILLTDEQKSCTHNIHVTPILPWDGSSDEYHHYRCDVCGLAWRTERFFRVFQGMETRQVCGVSGRPAHDLDWYWQPRDYDGDVLWSEGYQTREEAINAAIGNDDTSNEA